MYREDVFDGNGQLQARTTNKWDQTDLGNNRNLFSIRKRLKKL